MVRSPPHHSSALASVFRTAVSSTAVWKYLRRSLPSSADDSQLAEKGTLKFQELRLATSTLMKTKSLTKLKI